MDAVQVFSPAESCAFKDGVMYVVGGILRSQSDLLLMDSELSIEVAKCAFSAHPKSSVVERSMASAEKRCLYWKVSRGNG